MQETEITMPSVSIYKNKYEIFEEMTNEELGCLMRAVFAYANGKEVAEMPREIRFMFIEMRNEMNAQQAAYDDKSAKRSESGKKGGRPKKQEETEEADAFEDDDEETEKTDSFSEKAKKANGFSEKQKKPLNIKKEKEIKENEIDEKKEKAADAADMIADAETMSAIYDLADDMEMTGGRTAEKLNLLVADYSADWVLEAMERASDGQRSCWSIRYIKGILENWRRRGGIDYREDGGGGSNGGGRDSGYPPDFVPNFVENDPDFWKD